MGFAASSPFSTGCRAPSSSLVLPFLIAFNSMYSVMVSVMSLISLEIPFDAIDLTGAVSCRKCLSSEKVDERVPP